jgi:hypothetical protein
MRRWSSGLVSIQRIAARPKAQPLVKSEAAGIRRVHVHFRIAREEPGVIRAPSITRALAATVVGESSSCMVRPWVSAFRSSR